MSQGVTAVFSCPTFSICKQGNEKILSTSHAIRKNLQRPSHDHLNVAREPEISLTVNCLHISASGLINRLPHLRGLPLHSALFSVCEITHMMSYVLPSIAIATQSGWSICHVNSHLNCHSNVCACSLNVGQSVSRTVEGGRRD